MLSARLMRSALVVAPLCLALNPSVGDELTFHPKDGSSLSKTFEVSLDVKVDDLSFSVNGQDISENIPLTDANASVAGTRAITDQYVKVADGKPLELIRSFDDIKMKYEAGSNSGEMAEAEKLASKKVKFKWNADSKEYDVSYHETEGDSDLLEHLSEDMDLRAILPDHAVKQGDKWEVDAKGLMSVLLAGMKTDKVDLSKAPEEAQQILGEILPQIQKLGADIKTSCEYKGSRDVDGKRSAAIAIKVDGKPSIDLSGMIEELIKKQGETMGQELTVKVKKATVALQVGGEGELLWDLAEGHIHDFHMGSTYKINLDIDMAVSAQGQDQSVEGSVEASGKGDWKVSTK